MKVQAALSDQGGENKVLVKRVSLTTGGGFVEYRRNRKRENG